VDFTVVSEALLPKTDVTSDELNCCVIFSTSVRVSGSGINRPKSSTALV
jgi:hypothetical protein